MPILDISRPVFTAMPVWPGDSPVAFDFVCTIAGGASANVGKLATGVHAGTHADAPYHYDNAGRRMDEVPPEAYVGPARVIDARGRTTLTPELFAGHDWTATPRALVRTDAWTDPAVFPTTWPLFAPETPAWLATAGVTLVGLDVPSVDALSTTDMRIHHLFNRANLLIIENLDLSRAAPGVYEFIGLPLRLRGADGSPVRAVLRS
jgi:arylformamidase